MRPIRIVALGWLAAAAAGCVSAEDYFTPADLQGPPASIEGRWMVRGWTDLLDVSQDGGRASADAANPAWNAWFDDGRGNHLSVTGEVKGRVFHGVNDTDTWELVFQAAADGGDPRVTLISTVFENRAHWPRAEAARFKPTPSASDPRLGADHAVHGGLVCPVPFGPGGRIAPWWENDAELRPTLVTLDYSADEKRQIAPYRVILPLDGSREVAWVRFPAEGIFAKALDRGTLLRARRASRLHEERPGTLDGRPCWWVLNATWRPGASDPTPTVLEAELYLADPDGGALPVEVIEVARRQTRGTWEPTGGYIHRCARLTRATVALESGVPARVVVEEVSEPPLDDFLVVHESEREIARWRNRALLEVKNRTLPKLVGRLRTPELRDLVLRLEKAILDLNHEAELSRDRAQKLVEKSSASVHEARELKKERADVNAELEDPDLRHDPKKKERLTRRRGEIEAELARLEGAGRASESQVDELREMSTIYKERIEVVKGFLPAIKDEVANRGK